MRRQVCRAGQGSAGECRTGWPGEDAGRQGEGRNAGRLRGGQQASIHTSLCTFTVRHETPACPCLTSKSAPTCLTLPHPSPYPPCPATEDDDFLDVHFALDVRCTSDDTISVSSKDLQLDPRHPGACLAGWLAGWGRRSVCLAGWLAGGLAGVRQGGQVGGQICCELGRQRGQC